MFRLVKGQRPSYVAITDRQQLAKIGSAGKFYDGWMALKGDLPEGKKPGYDGLWHPGGAIDGGGATSLLLKADSQQQDEVTVQACNNGMLALLRSAAALFNGAGSYGINRDHQFRIPADKAIEALCTYQMHNKISDERARAQNFYGGSPDSTHEDSLSTWVGSAPGRRQTAKMLGPTLTRTHVPSVFGLPGGLKSRSYLIWVT